MPSDNPLDALRRRLGVDGGETKPKVKAGAIGPGTFEERQAAHKLEMGRLEAGGCDPGGKEALRRFFRGLGRRM